MGESPASTCEPRRMLEPVLLHKKRTTLREQSFAFLRVGGGESAGHFF